MKWYDCGEGLQVGVKDGTPLHDDEKRAIWEPLGYSMFAFFPVKCRNGKWRWLVDVDRHSDGTYTLGKYK